MSEEHVSSSCQCSIDALDLAAAQGKSDVISRVAPAGSSGITEIYRSDAKEIKRFKTHVAVLMINSPQVWFHPSSKLMELEAPACPIHNSD